MAALSSRCRGGERVGANGMAGLANFSETRPLSDCQRIDQGGRGLGYEGLLVVAQDKRERGTEWLAGGEINLSSVDRTRGLALTCSAHLPSPRGGVAGQAKSARNWRVESRASAASLQVTGRAREMR